MGSNNDDGLLETSNNTNTLDNIKLKYYLNNLEAQLGHFVISKACIINNYASSANL